MSASPIKPMTDADRSFIIEGGDPDHVRDLTAPCQWCGQTWHRLNGEMWELTHKDECPWLTMEERVTG